MYDVLFYSNVVLPVKDGKHPCQKCFVGQEATFLLYFFSTLAALFLTDDKILSWT